MKQKTQIGILLDWILKYESFSYNSILEYSITHSIVDNEEDLKKLLKYMEKKEFIIIDNNIINKRISQEEIAAKYSQTFINGGSSNKMIYTPPGTDISI